MEHRINHGETPWFWQQNLFMSRSKGQQKSSFAGGGTLIGRRFDVKDPHQLLSPVDGDSQGWKLKVVTWSICLDLKMMDEPPVSPSYGNLNREHDDKPVHGCTMRATITIFTPYFQTNLYAKVSFSGWNHHVFRGKPKNPTPHTTGLSNSGFLKTRSQLRFTVWRWMTFIFVTPKGTFPQSSAFPFIEHNQNHRNHQEPTLD